MQHCSSPRLFPLWVRNAAAKHRVESSAVADNAYRMHPFITTESNGWNTLVMADTYEGEVQAVASTRWRGSANLLEPKRYSLPLIVQPNVNLRAAILLRLFLVLFAYGASACSSVPARVSQVKELVPSGGAAYPAHSIGSWPLPIWLRFYSVLPGDAETDCKDPPRQTLSDSKHAIEVMNCSTANSLQTIQLLERLRDAVYATEERFGLGIQVRTTSIVIFAPEVGIWSRDVRWLRSDRLVLRLLGRYNSDQSQVSERALIRTVAHELFHPARMAGRWKRNSKPADISLEELRASLFEACIQYDVYSTLEPSNIVMERQVDIEKFSSDPVLHVSSQGSREALRLLNAMVGDDLSLAQERNRTSFARLCGGLVR